MESWTNSWSSTSGSAADRTRSSRPSAALISRSLLGALLFVALAVSCEQKTRPAPADPPPATTPNPSALPAPSAAAPTTSYRELTWDYPDAPFGPIRVVVSVPAGAAGQRYGVLVALHGRGEALKGPTRGARGWIDDYGLLRADARLRSPPLGREDYGGFVTPEHLKAVNQRLARRPYSGLIVVCPYLPDILRKERAFDEGPAYARFLVDTVLPRVYRETPARGQPSGTGLDGVSLGGRAALFAGFSRPEAFGSIGALQPAIDESEVDRLVMQARRAMGRNPKLELRLLTSTEDYFRDVTIALSQALTAAGVRHVLEEAVGPHNYAFNRGPGAFELLLFHDAVLRP